jgi:hypothetical protein
MARVRKDTLTTPVEWGKHLKQKLRFLLKIERRSGLVDAAREISIFTSQL